MTPEEALEAIRARIDGEWDNPCLMQLGPLHTSMQRDILRCLDLADMEAHRENEDRRRAAQRGTL
jgi:hypothetical protein